MEHNELYVLMASSMGFITAIVLLIIGFCKLENTNSSAILLFGWVLFFVAPLGFMCFASFYSYFFNS